jgi:hypothetical protein
MPTMNLLKRLLSLLALLTLAACGGGGGDSGTSVFGSGGGSGGGTGSGGTSPVYSLGLVLLDSNGAVTTSILAGQPVRAQATLLRNGGAVANELVQFTLVEAGGLVKLDPTAGTQLTDQAGVATVTVSALGANSGAGRITATSTISGTAYTATANFFTSGSGSNPPATLTLSGLEIGSNAVSAYGTTSVKVRVLQAGQPFVTGAVTVNFTTSCAAGKGSVTPNANTQPDGYAVATFIDNGCAQNADATVTITASIASDTKSGSLTVRSPTTGSLRFVSVTPSDKSITLRGQGGNGRQENAAVTFQVVDVAGQGVGNADVCFDSTTYVGGLNIDGFRPSNLPNTQGSTTLCGTDALSIVRYVKRTNPDGTVSIQVNSGTVPTPVRVRARVLYPSTATTPLESYSDTLSVSTGLPLQRSFSLSVDKANIDGGDIDGEVATLTARLADQFSNPVPDGTVVNFIASGAAVCTADNGSCRTTNGACTCNFVSQERRPQDNRVVVTAYAVGLEDFDDLNGDNVYTSNVDPFYDLGDASVDANKDGGPSSLTINGDTDILIPYVKPDVFSAVGDGVRGTAHIRRSTVMYLSRASSLGRPTAVVSLGSVNRRNSLVTGAADPGYFVRLQPNCPQGSPVPQSTLFLTLDDGHGNPMAAGTRLAPQDTSSNVAVPGFLPSSVLALGARPPFPDIDQPNTRKPLVWDTTDAHGTVTSAHTVTVQGVEGKCSGTGSFTLGVTSPRGGSATATVLFEQGSQVRPDPADTLINAVFPVVYSTIVNFNLGRSGLNVTVTPQNWISQANGAAAASYSIDWGDGSFSTGSTPGGVMPNVTHTYALAGTYSVSLTVIDAALPVGNRFSTSTLVTVN